jgi:hypothetical protein
VVAHFLSYEFYQYTACGKPVAKAKAKAGAGAGARAGAGAGAGAEFCYAEYHCDILKTGHYKKGPSNVFTQ